jgi:hypothetical protein
MRTPVDAASRREASSIYVYLCSGEVVELHPATSVQLTERFLDVLNGKVVVTSFSRASVYFVSDEPMAPSSL